MQPIDVFFIRGLSTTGHDNAHFAVFNFGPVYKHLARELEKRGVRFHPLVGLGAGFIPEIAERARNAILNHPVWKAGGTVHILAHSAGGLAGRLAFESLKDESRIRSLLTFASPNRGTGMARRMLDIPTMYPRSDRILKTVGYDVRYKSEFFEELTKEGVTKLFSSGWTDPRIASIVCWEPRERWCLPLRAFYTVKAFSDYDQESDGIVDRDTQDVGRVIAELNIDHIRQVGLFDSGRRFAQQCDVIADFFKKEARNS